MFFVLFLYRFIQLPTYPSMSLSVFLCLYLCIYLSIYRSIYRSIYLSICLSVHLSSKLSIYLPMCLSMHLFIRQVLSPPVLRSTSWPVPRRQQNNAARLLLATSKTKQFCETFSLFAVENIKNEAILRDFLQKWKVDCTADGLVPMRFCDLSTCRVSKVLRLPRKS